MKNYLVLLMTLLIFSKIEAQRKIKYEINAGSAYLDLNNINLNRKFGYQAGIGVDIKLGHHFYLNGQLNYQRFRMDLNGLSRNELYYDFIEYKPKVNLSYLILPIAIKYNIPKTHITLLAGAQINYKISGNVEYPNGVKVDTAIIFYKTTYNWFGGIEYNIPIRNNRSIFINAKYYSSIGNGYNLNMSRHGYKSYGYLFTVGYRFYKYIINSTIEGRVNNQ
ncbi:outer membrane beta-barrel protein [Rhizosphaericola mali]|uniref:PorT family protein n=1 Tax=Rhizosphaericola mali TaxID=2545455 RepID=A0A5P2G667_9BACT|nr:outer membrane beta-barrel protein [Rhizosphaericola mali]QES88683.1 PorT family protein [Rhizosphaericola mali]